ncbi:MAG TPA: metallophosphoesterase, partial [Pyrinomonadaceae bacterium]|nr:metallophosphoesterase [Pyrinomonadaceae bacterium]
MRKWIKRILLIAAIVIVTALMLLGYAYFIEPRRLVVTESELRVPNFDPELNGLKIVAISDIHAGSNHVTHEKLREIVAAANQQNPDLILLLGDYVSQSDGTHSPLVMPVNEIAENLKGFSARYGIYGVIGNHDWWY